MTATLIVLAAVSLAGRLALLALATQHVFRAMTVAPGRRRRRHVYAAAALLLGAVIRL